MVNIRNYSAGNKGTPKKLLQDRQSILLTQANALKLTLLPLAYSGNSVPNVLVYVV